MRLNIRLQNHGYQNHPLWWIVVAPSKRRVRGNFVQHIGYWIPRQGKENVDRSIVINQNRAQYWLAMGAEPTFKVQKFMSLMDLMPAPLVKFGKQTMYEQPDAPMSYENKLNFYKFPKRGHQLSKILKDQQENYRMRMALIENEIFKQNQMITEPINNDQVLSLKQIEQEIAQCKEQLIDLQSQISVGTTSQTEILKNRINYLYVKLVQEKDLQGIRDHLNNEHNSGEVQGEISKENLQLKLERKAFEKQISNWGTELQKKLDLSSPITRDELMKALLDSGMNQMMAEKRAWAIFRDSQANNMVVDTQTAISETRPNQGQHSKYDMFRKDRDFSVNYSFPSLTVHPKPDLTIEDPQDFYEIPQTIDPVGEANKAVHLKNITDRHIPKRPPVTKLKIHYFKQVTGHKKRQNLRRGGNFYFSTQITKIQNKIAEEAEQLYNTPNYYLYV